MKSMDIDRTFLQILQMLSYHKKACQGLLHYYFTTYFGLASAIIYIYIYMRVPPYAMADREKPLAEEICKAQVHL